MKNINSITDLGMKEMKLVCGGTQFIDDETIAGIFLGGIGIGVVMVCQRLFANNGARVVNQ